MQNAKYLRMNEILKLWFLELILLLTYKKIQTSTFPVVRDCFVLFFVHKTNKCMT